LEESSVTRAVPACSEAGTGEMSRNDMRRRIYEERGIIILIITIDFV